MDLKSIKTISCPTNTVWSSSSLPRFLDNIENIGLAVYNAGTDILAGDPVGALGVSRAGVLERDLFVFKLLQERSIPTVMMPSGGYTRESYKLIADSVSTYLKQD